MEYFKNTVWIFLFISIFTLPIIIILGIIGHLEIMSVLTFYYRLYIVIAITVIGFMINDLKNKD